MATPAKEIKKINDTPQLPEANNTTDIKMRCLELAKSIPAGQEELLEKKAGHLYNWIMNGENK